MMCQGRMRQFAGWLLLGSILGIRAGTVLGADRAPNIVLIVADDLGWGDVGFNGRTEWTTPHLDRLAADGVVLKHCYSAAPICGPSRGALLTGKYTIHTGVRRNDQDLPLEEVTIAEALKHRGYKSGLFGKWQHGKPRSGRDHYVHPMDQGFDDFFGFTDSYDALEKFPTRLWRGRERVRVSGYVDDLITDRAIEFLGRQQDAPFFLDVSYLAPHFSIAAPAEEIEHLKGKVPEADPLHPQNAIYAAMITRMDWNIGRLLDTLGRLHRIEDTLLVFTSDNGATFEFGNQGRAPRWTATGRCAVRSALFGKAAFEFPGWLTGRARSAPDRSARKTSTSPICFPRWSRPPVERSMRPGTSTASTCCPSGPAKGTPRNEPCSGNGRAREPTSSPHCGAASSW